MTSSSNFFDSFLFILSSLVTGPSFMYISSLVLELWQFSFMRDWPEIWKLEIPLSGFCSVSEDWDELQIPNLPRMSLIKYYWMLQNARVTAFTVFELLRKNQQGDSRLGLIEHNMRNILFKKPHIKCVGDTIPRLFSKKSRSIISLAKLRAIKIYWN